MKSCRRIGSTIILGTAITFAVGLGTRGLAVEVETERKLNVLAKPRLSRGWATFGLALPQGAAKRRVSIAGVPTQTDLKAAWPDGSIKFAIVSAKVAEDAERLVTPDDSNGSPSESESVSTFDVEAPKATVRFRIGQELYAASPPDKPTNDAWLLGPLVREWRAEVAPISENGTPHPFLRVLFDSRIYREGDGRLDVTVENVLDKEGATGLSYDVEILIAGKRLFHREKVPHYYLSRWRKVFPLGSPPSRVRDDLEPFFRAGAIPRFVEGIGNKTDVAKGPTFDILNVGNLAHDMAGHGGRAELGPYPAWIGRYLSARNPAEKEFMLLHGDLAGTWPIHLREPEDGRYRGFPGSRYVSIDERPNFWLDGRADPGDKQAGRRGDLEAPFRPELNHTPSLAYVPYLLTGDRYLADETAAWANFALIKTWQARGTDKRGGAKGLLVPNETRGFAWSLRNLADAAAYLPDGDARKAHFAEKVRNNLEWLDAWAVGARKALDVAWIRFRTNEPVDPEHRYTWLALWEHNYLAWAVDRASKLGFRGGLKWRDQVVAFQVRLLTERGFPKEFGAPYVLAVRGVPARLGNASEPGGDRDLSKPQSKAKAKASTKAKAASKAQGKAKAKIDADPETSQPRPFYSSPSEVFAATDFLYQSTGAHLRKVQWPTPIAGYYGVDARLIVLIGLENRFAGAREAFEFLDPRVTDLKGRPGWALAIDSNSLTFPQERR